MAYNEILADRVREALADLPNVIEKKMFSGYVLWWMIKCAVVLALMS